MVKDLEIDWPSDAFVLPMDALDESTKRIYVEYYAPAFQSGGWLVVEAESEGDTGREYPVPDKSSAKNKAIRLSDRIGVPIVKEVLDTRM